MITDFSSRLFQNRLFKDEKFATFAFIIIGLLMLAILINVIYLNSILLKKTNHSSTTINKSTSTNVSLSPTLLPTISTPTILPSPTVANLNSAKDYYIALGTGSTQATTWTDIPGVAAQLNFGDYGNIKEIHFEASLLTPSANQSVSVQLFNVTDGHSVWYSNMTMASGQTSQYLTSNPLSYDTGSKLYQVQMETQLGAPATLVQARIHIILK